MGTEKDSDINKIDFDEISDTETDANNDLGLKSNTFNIIDNKYLTGKKKTRAIF